MSENTTQTVNPSIKEYTLDGQPTTLLEINTKRNQKGIKIVESAPGVFKTLQRING